MNRSLRPLKQRNPVALAARLRRAGAHGPGGKSRRQNAHRALCRELMQLAAAPDRHD